MHCFIHLPFFLYFGLVFSSCTALSSYTRHTEIRPEHQQMCTLILLLHKVAGAPGEGPLGRGVLYQPEQRRPFGVCVFFDLGIGSRRHQWRHGPADWCPSPVHAECRQRSFHPRQVGYMMRKGFCLEEDIRKYLNTSRG